MNLFDKLFDAVAWIKIFLSLFIIGAIGGFICWIYSDNYLFKLLSVLIILLGTIAGIYFAERVRKKMSTQEFVSRIDATPDIDNKESYTKK